MEKKLVLEINVSINPAEISELSGAAGSVLCIPFSGTVSGEIFNGKICPGGVDVQKTNLSNVRHMFARYMLEGTDPSGEACHIYVENNGWFMGETGVKEPFKTVPVFMTDSKTLAPYLHQTKFVGEGTPNDDGVIIRIYEVL